MKAVLIIAHAPLASALEACALHVFPELASAMASIDVHSHEDQEQVLARCLAVMDNLTSEPDVDGVMMLTDVFGATPCNAATRALQQPNTRLLSGANVPMVLKALSYRHETLDNMVMRATASATQGIMSVAPVIPLHQQQTQRRRSYDQHHRDHQQ